MQTIKMKYVAYFEIKAVDLLLYLKYLSRFKIRHFYKVGQYGQN